VPHRRSYAAANAAADGICGLCDDGSIRIYAGTQPATPDDAPAGAMLAEPTLSSPAFAAAVDGTAVAHLITDAVAVATGDAAWYRLTASDGGAVTDDECGLIGSGAALELETLSINAGDRVTIPHFSHTEPKE
jgi:hypothetical protein